MIKSTILRWEGRVTRMEEGMGAFTILTGKPTGKRPLERPRDTRNWIHSAQDTDYLRMRLNL